MAAKYATSSQTAKLLIFRRMSGKELVRLISKNQW